MKICPFYTASRLKAMMQRLLFYAIEEKLLRTLIFIPYFDLQERYNVFCTMQTQLSPKQVFETKTVPPLTQITTDVLF